MARNANNPVRLADPGRGMNSRQLIPLDRDPLASEFRRGDTVLNRVSKHVWHKYTPGAWTDLGLARGEAAWTAVYAMVPDGTRLVRQIVDWVGGEGTKPAVGAYDGPTGPVDDIEDAVGIETNRFKGNYNSGTAYKIGDMAAQQSALWTSLQAHTNHAPPTLPTVSNAYWHLVAGPVNITDDLESNSTSLIWPVRQVREFVATKNTIFASRAAVELYEPTAAPALIEVDGVIYDYAVSAPAHDGYVQDGLGHFYVMRRSPVVYVEGFRDSLDIDGPGDSSAGFAKAVGMLAQEGGGKLIFPRASFVGMIELPGNSFIDFNGSLITPPNMTLEAIRVYGTSPLTGYQLASDVQRGDMVLPTTAPVSDISAGDMITIEDASARITDGQQEISVETHIVEAVSGSSITLFEPLHARKTAGGVNIRKVNPKQNVELVNLNTTARNGAVAGNGGLLARWVKGLVVDVAEHSNGVGAAWSFQRSINVIAERLVSNPAQVTGSGQGYGLQLFAGVRHARVGVSGEGLRHTLDLDSSYFVDATVTSRGDLSSSVVLSHNGMGGDLRIRAEVFDAPAWAVNTQDWYSITGLGGSGAGTPLHNINLDVVTHHKNDGGADKYGVYFKQPIKGLTGRVRAVIGNGREHCSSGGLVPSAAMRLHPDGNSGDISVFSRGHGSPVFRNNNLAAAAYLTDDCPPLTIRVDADWYKYGVFSTYAQDVIFEDSVFGPNHSTGEVFNITNDVTAPLKTFVLDNVEVQSAGTMMNTINPANLGLGHGTKGKVSGLRVKNSTAKTVADTAFVLTSADILRLAGGAVALTAANATALTTIANGIVEDQELVLLGGAGGAVTINDIANQVVLKTSPTVLGSKPMRLRWINSVWREV